jgi:hypothetical protein
LPRVISLGVVRSKFFFAGLELELTLNSATVGFIKSPSVAIVHLEHLLVGYLAFNRGLKSLCNDLSTKRHCCVTLKKQIRVQIRMYNWAGPHKLSTRVQRGIQLILAEPSHCRLVGRQPSINSKKSKAK